MNLNEALPLPAEDLGVTNEACEAEVENLAHPEMLDHLHVSQLSDLGIEGKLALAAVPLIDHRGLRGTGEDEPLLTLYIQKLHVGVTMPRMKGLVGVETIAVPAINASGACLGAVCYCKVPFPIQLEGLHKVGLSHTSGVNVLDFHESLWVLFPSAEKVSVRTTISSHHELTFTLPTLGIMQMNI